MTSPHTTPCSRQDSFEALPNFTNFQYSAPTPREQGYQSFEASYFPPSHYYPSQGSRISNKNLHRLRPKPCPSNHEKINSIAHLNLREPRRRNSDFKFEKTNETSKRRSSSTTPHELHRTLNFESSIKFKSNGNLSDNRFIRLSSPSRVISRGSDVVAEGRMVTQDGADKSIRHSLRRAIKTSITLGLEEQLSRIENQFEENQPEDTGSGHSNPQNNNQYISFSSMNLIAPPSPPPSIIYLEDIDN